MKTPHLWFFLGHALLAALPLQAQDRIPNSDRVGPFSDEALAWLETPCNAEDGRTVRGVFRDDRGTPVFGAYVIFEEHRCGARVVDGVYVARNVPRSESRMWFATPDLGAVQHWLVTPRDTVIDRILPARNHVRDWTEYPSRPSAPEEVEGIAGCYWMGRDLYGRNRNFRLLQDGRVEASGHGQLIEPGWSRIEDGQRVKVVFLRLGSLGQSSITFDLSEVPIDWSALPSLYVYDSDAYASGEWDSFVSRVECPTRDSP